MSEAIIFQSIMDTTSGLPYQQLSNLCLEGLSTRSDTLNTDVDQFGSGKLYASLTLHSGVYALNLYKDVIKTELVAQASSATLGVATIYEENGSRLSGTVNFAQYLHDDTAIQVLCFLSSDVDLPMDNLNTLTDYDQTVGFAYYHLNAFNYLTHEFIVSRYKSKVWNRFFIDTNQINGGLGGYDLSRCLNLWVLREASAHYAFSRIAEKQAVEPNGIFDRRARESKGILRAHLQNLELVFDDHNTRVESSSRSFNVWKISRA